MKRLFTLLSTLLLLFVWSCGDDGGTITPNDKPDNTPGDESVFVIDGDGNYVVESRGGKVEVSVMTNIEYNVEIPAEAQEWLSVADTRATRLEKLTFTVARNVSESERSATIELVDESGKTLQSVSFLQKGAAVDDGGEDDDEDNGTTEEEENVDIPEDTTQFIEFADASVKQICTQQWDIDEDGELSYDEAAAVTELGVAFKGSNITSFIELKYFTQLQDISESAFEGCGSMVKVVLPEEVATIGARAFKGCTNLNNVTLHDGIDTIGEEAFAGCANMTSLILPSALESVATKSYMGCSNLKKVNFGGSISSVGDKAFYDTELLEEIYFITATPPTLADNCFDCSSERAANPVIYLPEGYVQSYNDCDWPQKYKEWILGFTAEQWPSSQIIEYTTSDNKVLPLYWEEDGDRVDFSFGKAEVLSNTYEDGKGTILFSSPVRVIGNEAFVECETLTSITLPSQLTTIEAFAFADCYSLEGIVIPESVTSIGEYAFAGCESFKSITIPESVTYIGESAFAYCLELEAIYGKGASDDNRCLIFDDTLVVFASKGISSYETPQGVKVIGSESFCEAESLEEVVVSEGVTDIEDFAFCECVNLQKVTLPQTLTLIDYYAFSGTESLAEIIFNGTTPPMLSADVFDADRTSNPVIYVPEGAIDNYLNSEWPVKYKSWIDGADFPTITFDCEQQMFFDYEGGQGSIYYSLLNPNADFSLIEVVSDVEWITDIDTSTYGTITFTVAPYYYEEGFGRFGNIRVSYGSQNMDVSIEQVSGMPAITYDVDLTSDYVEGFYLGETPEGNYNYGWNLYINDGTKTFEYIYSVAVISNQAFDTTAPKAPIGTYHLDKSGSFANGTIYHDASVYSVYNFQSGERSNTQFSDATFNITETGIELVATIDGKVHRVCFEGEYRWYYGSLYGSTLESDVTLNFTDDTEGYIGYFGDDTADFILALTPGPGYEYEYDGDFLYLELVAGGDTIESGIEGTYTRGDYAPMSCIYGEVGLNDGSIAPIYDGTITITKTTTDGNDVYTVKVDCIDDNPYTPHLIQGTWSGEFIFEDLSSEPASVSSAKRSSHSVAMNVKANRKQYFGKSTR